MPARVWRGVKRPVNQRTADARRWAEVRLAGGTVAAIARGEGVSAATVSRASSTAVIARRGALPAATVPVWAARRREGARVPDVAQDAGWSETMIYRLTRGLGPYPRPQPSDARRGHVDPPTVR